VTGSSSGNLLALWRNYENDPIAADAIYTTLREAILTGLLAPGERLAELELAARFNRSRTPVREALLRLESQHLVERSERGSFVVSGISREEILEVYAVREVIDGLAARLAAEGCPARDLEHLAWINRRLAKAAEQHDYRLMVELNIEFHEAIGRASRNALLIRFMRQIHDWVRRFSDTTLSYRGRAAEALQEHESLLDALKRHDADAAERIARVHMARATQVRIMMRQSSSHDDE
jgi:DNA-binding GntR family transcriptional regulator